MKKESKKLMESAKKRAVFRTRNTKKRQFIQEAILCEQGVFAAKDITNRLEGTVSQKSVYNNIILFINEGFIEQVPNIEVVALYKRVNNKTTNE